jgi:hypothetical protein
MKITLSDVSAIPYGVREQHYLDSWGGQDTRRRLAIAPDARAQAQGEMLDEIHVMLLHLCGIKDDGSTFGDVATVQMVKG